MADGSRDPRTLGTGTNRVGGREMDDPESLCCMVEIASQKRYSSCQQRITGAAGGNARARHTCEGQALTHHRGIDISRPIESPIMSNKSFFARPRALFARLLLLVSVWLLVVACSHPVQSHAETTTLQAGLHPGSWTRWWLIALRLPA